MPSFVHVITGSGIPDALHRKVTLEFGEATMDPVETVTVGRTRKNVKKL